MNILRTPSQVASISEQGYVLVPTMGALHEGHLSLIRRGAEIAQERKLPGGCVPTVFVNPTQFGERADFDRYPRVEKDDARLAQEAGASAVFVPSVDTVYPDNVDVPVGDLPPQAREPGLEDAHRPGHFEGVVQVVRRLFELVKPRAAVFGEKDWQQLQVVRAMTEAEGLGVDVIGMPTVREPDGVAMSSRNRFLAPADRERASAIPLALEAAARMPTPDEAETRMREVLTSAGLTRIDYAVVRDAATLMAPARGRPCRALIVVRLGEGGNVVRLLDNAPWGSV